MQTQTTYKCARCNGLGRISAFTNVIGGTCFKCNGRGVQTTKPRKPMPKWAVFGRHSATGNLLRLYNVVARTKEKAIQTAHTCYDRASTDWRKTYDMQKVEAIKWADMKDQSAITWEAASPRH